MYKVVNWCQQGDEKAFAVMNITTGSVEVIAEKDIKLLTFIGMKMQTLSGEDVRVDGDTLVCNVDEFIPAEESDGGLDEDDGVDWSDFESEDDGSEEGSEDGDEYSEADDWGDYSEEDEGDETEDEDDWDGFDAYYGDDDSGTVEESEVSKFYKLLNPEQLGVVREYYLWYSRRLFVASEEAAAKKSGAGIVGNQGSTLSLGNVQTINAQLRASSKKEAKMKVLRGDEDFRYAGFLDMAPVGGSHCDLGHALRYLHIAWNIKVQDIDTVFFGQSVTPDYLEIIKQSGCLVFGKGCIGDFFGVSPEVKNLLGKVQMDSLNDLAILYRIYAKDTEEPGYSDTVKASFALFDEVFKQSSRVDMMSKSPVFPFKSAEMFNKFRKVGLIPPKSLVQEFRSCVVGWTDGTKYFRSKWYSELKYPTPDFYERLEKLVGMKYKSGVAPIRSHSYVLRSKYYNTAIERLVAFVYLMFTYEICGHYKYTAKKGEYNDEGGTSQDVRTELYNLYKYSLHNDVQNGAFNMDTLKRILSLVVACQPASGKYKAEDYKLTYYSEMYDKQSQASIETGSRWGEARMNSTYRRIVEAYVNANGNGDRVYELIRFMSNVLLAGTDLFDMLMLPKTLLKYSDFKQFVDNQDKVDTHGVAGVVPKVLAEVDDLFAKLKQFSIELADSEEEHHKNKRLEEEKRKEAERKAKEEADRKAREEAERQKAFEEGDRRLSEIERSVEAGAEASAPTTRDELIQFLTNKDFSGITLSGEAEFGRSKILRSIGRQKSAVSDSQFWYLQVLYQEVTGVDYTGAGALAEKPGKQKAWVDLSTRKDIEDAIDWVTANQFAAEVIADAHNMRGFETFVSILGTIKRTGRISEKQMRYAEVAISIAQEGKS